MTTPVSATEKPTDWNWLEKLEAACVTEPSEEERQEMRSRAMSWPTCACGELCKTLPRHPNYTPMDAVLKQLGYYFNSHIEDECWPEALATFHKIEARTAELLAEMAAGK